MEVNDNIYVIVVAAGTGTRFGASLPKQFCMLGGRPVLMTTLDRLHAALPAARILLVLSADGCELWREQCRQFNYVSPETVIGGATRWASVKNALDRLDGLTEHDIVMVHDGARPLVDRAVVDRLIAAVNHNVAALPVIAVADSLRLVDSDGESESLDRSRVKAVQTPQVFRGDLLQRAYRLPYSPLFTDDASVMSAAGFHSPTLVEGSPRCLKITLPIDLTIASLYLEDDRLT